MSAGVCSVLPLQFDDRVGGLQIQPRSAREFRFETCESACGIWETPAQTSTLVFVLRKLSRIAARECRFPPASCFHALLRQTALQHVVLSLQCVQQLRYLTNLISESEFMKTLTLTFVCTLLLTLAGQAAEWGTISGRIVLDGDVPKPELLNKKGDVSVKDFETCAAMDMYKDDLVIDADSKGIANIFIYLFKPPADIYPEATKVPATVVFDQKNCIFKPHAMVLQVGQTVEVLNSDPIAHNTHTIPLKNNQINVLLAPNTVAGAGVMVPTTIRENLPHEVKCDVHGWMKAYWLVLDHPYMAVTDAKGNFTIKNLPVGAHEFRIWQERCGYIDRKYEVTVTAGENKPLDPIKVTLSQLDDK